MLSCAALTSAGLPIVSGVCVDRSAAPATRAVHDAVRSLPFDVEHGAHVRKTDSLRSEVAAALPAAPAAGGSTVGIGASTPRPDHAGAFLSRYPSGPPASSGLTGDVSAVRASSSSRALCTATGASSRTKLCDCAGSAGGCSSRWDRPTDASRCLSRGCGPVTTVRPARCTLPVGPQSARCRRGVGQGWSLPSALCEERLLLHTVSDRSQPKLQALARRCGLVVRIGLKLKGDFCLRLGSGTGLAHGQRLGTRGASHRRRLARFV